MIPESAQQKLAALEVAREQVLAAGRKDVEHHIATLTRDYRRLLKKGEGASEEEIDRLATEFEIVALTLESLRSEALGKVFAQDAFGVTVL
jgi:predicted DNA-binding protein (UPF0278 family)